jgi:tyrosine aminotransferase
VFLFTLQAALSEDVPVLSVGALSKRWLVPGWCARTHTRVNAHLHISMRASLIHSPALLLSACARRCGWLLVHDRHRALANAGIVEALSRLVQISIGPTVPVQASVPHLLANTPRAWHDAQCAAYAAAAALCCARAGAAPGISVDAPPTGAMYLLVTIALEQFNPAVCGADDVAWSAALQREEAVLLLPGTAFGAPGRVRLVLCAPAETLNAAWDRIDAFVARHHLGGGGAK